MRLRLVPAPKDAGDALNKMAARTGVSTEALSELGFAAEDDAINARRDNAVNERETERQRRRAAIEGERAGVEDELNRMQEAERAEREKRKQETLAAGLSMSYAGKHFPNATSNFSGPASRIFRRSRAQTMLFSRFRNPSHVCESAVTCRSNLPT